MHVCNCQKVYNVEFCKTFANFVFSKPLLPPVHTAKKWLNPFWQTMFDQSTEIKGGKFTAFIELGLCLRFSIMLMINL